MCDMALIMTRHGVCFIARPEKAPGDLAREATTWLQRQILNKHVRFHLHGLIRPLGPARGGNDQVATAIHGLSLLSHRPNMHGKTGPLGPARGGNDLVATAI